MNGLLDFLKRSVMGEDVPQGGQSFQGSVGISPDVAPELAPQMAEPGLLQHAPVMEHRSGLLEDVRRPDSTGVSMLDRIGAGARVYRDDAQPGDGMQQISDLRRQNALQAKEAKLTAGRAKKNAAFRAAYQGGKFDPAAYMAGLEDADVDVTDALDFQKALAPKGGVDGGTAYTIDPISGATTWGEQRDMSHSEQLAEQRDQELQDYRKQQIRLGEGRLGVAERNAGTSDYRAHKPPGGGAQSWLPPGARVVQIGR